MSDGTWEDPTAAAHLGYVETRARGRRQAERGENPRADRPGSTGSVLWSPCDEGCRHDGEHVRALPTWRVEASWRQVDVRTLGWAFDLRPESTAILCVRCWATR